MAVMKLGGAEDRGRVGHLVREGDYWAVVFDGRGVRVRDSKGMGYLAELLSRPGQEISALELASGSPTEVVLTRAVVREGLSTAGEADLGPVLDQDAKRAYKHRLEELRAEQAEAEAFHDPERAARARVEYEFIADELTAAVGLRGRDRRAGSPAERARLNVTRAIRASVEHLREYDGELGEYLTKTVVTGRACSYRPERSELVHWRIVTRPPVSKTARRFERPETEYVRTGGASLAYQVFGEGPIDVLFLPSWLSHLDIQWTDPTCTSLLRNLAGFARVIAFDMRGVGLSDPVAALPTLDERMDDVGAVMDAAGSERAVLFGLYGSTGILAAFAAAHPERTRALVLYGAAPAGPGAAAFPGSTEFAAMFAQLSASVDTGWGRGATLAAVAPEFENNRIMRRLWGVFERASMSPGVARSMLDWLYRMDVSAALPAIRVPTLILHCTGDTMPIATGRHVAEMIPGARFRALPGDWHAPITGDMRLLTGAMEEFIATLPDETPSSSLFASALVVTADEEIPADERVADLGGVVVDRTAGRWIARFGGPSRAIQCAMTLVEDAETAGREVRAGLHAGQCELSPDGLHGVPVLVADQLCERALPGEVLVTGVIRDLALGSGTEFDPRGVLRITGVPGQWPIFAAVGLTSTEYVEPTPSVRTPLFDRAALTMARRAPALGRSTLRIVKGDM